MKKKTVVNYKEISIFILILLLLIFILVKIIPASLRSGVLLTISIAMLIMPLMRKKVVETDERNLLIDLKAKAFAFNLLEFIFGFLILIFSIIKVDFLVTASVLIAYLVLKMANLLAISYYHRNY